MMRYLEAIIIQRIDESVPHDPEVNLPITGPSACDYTYIAQRTQESPCDQIFVYQPDIDCHTEFFHCVKTRPLPINILGMSSILDTHCIWMKFIRSTVEHISKMKLIRLNIISIYLKIYQLEIFLKVQQSCICKGIIKNLKSQIGHTLADPRS